MNSPVYTKRKGFFSTFFVVWLMVGGPPNQQLSTPSQGSTLQGTNISPTKGSFEDDFAFPKVGYVSFLELDPGLKDLLPTFRGKNLTTTISELRPFRDRFVSFFTSKTAT